MTQTYWYVISAVVGFGLFLCALYTLGCIQFVDTRNYALENGKYFMGGMSAALNTVPFAFYIYVGQEIVNLTSDDIENPRENIYRSSVSSVTFYVMLVIAVVVVGCGLPGGVEHLSLQYWAFDDGKNKPN